MTGPVLKVDPQALQGAGQAFGRAGDEIGRLDAGAALGRAASGVPELATAAACHAAEATVSADVKAAADAAHEFGSNLGSAASQYVRQDQAAAGAVDDVQFPS